ncbi:MAG: hypothetical protein AAF614_19685 [Chloroflexota bacterium]
MNDVKPKQTNMIDNSRKSILARGCDPNLSSWAAKNLPPLIGNPEYVPTTNDVDFIEKLQSRAWSVVYFAPGACRFSAAKRQIPGGVAKTRGWTLEDYRELVQQLQGDGVPIVESVEESKSLELLRTALEQARETNA